MIYNTNGSSNNITFKSVISLHGNDAASYPRVHFSHVGINPRHPGFSATNTPTDRAPQKVAAGYGTGHWSATVTLTSVLRPINSSCTDHVFIDES